MSCDCSLFFGEFDIDKPFLYIDMYECTFLVWVLTSTSGNPQSSYYPFTCICPSSEVIVYPASRRCLQFV
jgi:hypothetical protein